MEIPKEKLPLIIIGSVLIAIFGIYLTLYRPLGLKVAKAHYECADIEREISECRHLIASSKNVTLKKGFIHENEIPLAIDELTQIGKANGLRFVSLKPGEVAKGKTADYNIMPIEIDVRGTYEQLGKFIGMLDESVAGLITIKRFRITNNDEDPQRLEAFLILSLHIFGEGHGG